MSVGASSETVMRTLEVLRKHLTEEQIHAVVRELYSDVNGNDNFMVTIERLYRAAIGTPRADDYRAGSWKRKREDERR